MRRGLRALLLAALGAALALGPAEGVQLFAWAGMLARDLRTDRPAEAMARSLSGDAPCPLCRAAAALREQEREPAAPVPPPAKPSPWALAEPTRLDLPDLLPAPPPAIAVVAPPPSLHPAPDEPVPRS